jgi:hypothetical protein
VHPLLPHPKDLRIGDAEAKVRSLMPCKPDHVNTTQTAHVYHEQWVFETSSWGAFTQHRSQFHVPIFRQRQTRRQTNIGARRQRLGWAN